MEELGNMSSSEFQVGEPDADPDLRLLETVSLRVEPSKSVSRSMVSLESVPSSLVDWPASRLRLYSFPWRRRSTASHILTHQVLRIRRRFRSALFLVSLLFANLSLRIASQMLQLLDVGGKTINSKTAPCTALTCAINKCPDDVQVAIGHFSLVKPLVNNGGGYIWG